MNAYRGFSHSSHQSIQSFKCFYMYTVTLRSMIAFYVVLRIVFGLTAKNNNTVVWFIEHKWWL